MKVFVTGGAGFIGSNFIRYLLALNQGYSVVNYDKLTYAGNLANLTSVAADANYTFVLGDICDAALVQKSMRGCDAVVHFAAESHVDRSIYEPGPVIDTNITGTFVLLRIARELKIARFVHISTDEVYGDIAAGASSAEGDPVRPSSPYSASKASADLLVLSFVRTYGLPAVVTRASNNYGPFQFPEKFLPLMICNAMQHQPLPVYGDGLQERDWLHVEDHCRAIELVLRGGRRGEIYNIGGGSVFKNIEMVRQVLSVLGRPESLIQSVVDRPGHDRRYSLNCSKITAELGWRPQRSLEQGLRHTIEWYRANPAWVEAVRGGEYRSYYQKFYVERATTINAIAGSNR